MASTIDQSFIDQYKANIHMLLEQGMSKFKPFVRIEAASGERHFFETLGGVEAHEVDASFSDTVYQDSNHGRRMAIVRLFHANQHLSHLDSMKMLIDPKSAYVKRVAAALGRKFDAGVIEALTGTAYGGKDGNTAIALPAAQKVAEGGTGLTVAKLRATSLIFKQAEMMDGELIMAVTPAGMDDLLGETEVTSSDYNTVKALVQGEIDSFMGFKFIISNLVPAGKAIAFARDAIGAAEGKALEIKHAELPEKNYDISIDAYQGFGFVRIEDELVVEVSHT